MLATAMKSICALTFAFTGAPALAAPAATKISGTVKVAPDLAKDVTPTSILYVIARPEGQKAGPPAAVLRMGAPKFPATFELGAENMMMGGEFKGPYDITVKLSKTGDVITSPGDLLGESEPKKAHKAGDKDVQLVLKTKAK